MPFTNGMSDGRNFTDYRTQKGQMETIRGTYGTSDSKSLRYAMIQNAEVIMNKQTCTKGESQGMAVLCGGPLSQYVSTKSTISEFPKGPIQ
tara:strand:+ start:37 stop:309 length:273 start_codon:yes stop_codon:yes gene_type:complete